MIYLAIALYAEAKPFIQTLGLKSQETHCRFPLFTSDTHRLILTGSGPLLAAIADTWLLSHFQKTTLTPDASQAEDCFAQIGCAAYLPKDEGTAVSQGNLYLCHKLTDAQTGHSAYPDMLYRSDFAQASLITYPVVQTQAADTQTVDFAASALTLTDMEGYAGYQAASVFLPPHRIFTWKVLSDYGDTKNLVSQDISGLFTPHTENILSWLDWVCTPSAAGSAPLSFEAIKEAYPICWKIADIFGYSSTQRQQLRQLLHYAFLTGDSETDLLAGLSDTIHLHPQKPPVFSFHPAQRKKEGKRILYELEQRLLS